MQLYRQGEVFLTQIPKKEVPKDLKQKDNVLAHGTTTGHSHILDGNAKTFLDEATNTQYVTVPKTSSQLTHEEHTAITVEKGTYKVTIQQEYDILRDEIRAVRD